MFYECKECSISQPCYFYDPSDEAKPVSCPVDTDRDPEWQSKNGMITIDQRVGEIVTDKIEQLENELAELRVLKSVCEHSCECSLDDACHFARQRDEAREERDKAREEIATLRNELDALRKQSEASR